MTADRPEDDGAGWHADPRARRTRCAPPTPTASGRSRGLREHALTGPADGRRARRALRARVRGADARTSSRSSRPTCPRGGAAARGRRAPSTPAGSAGGRSRSCSSTRWRPDAAMRAALRSMAPALARGGYELVERSERAARSSTTPTARAGSRCRSSCSRSRASSRCCIKEHDRVMVDLEARRGGGTRLVVRGVAPRRVRRAFAELGPLVLRAPVTPRRRPGAP